MINAGTATGAHQKHPAADRSVPRWRVRSGDSSIDRRGRRRRTPAVLSYGFRPFFLGASVYAALIVPVWLWLLRSGASPRGPFTSFDWHAHEMIFGYLAAVMAGFILTAVPNWTGRLPLSGAPLAVLFGIWIAGRIACSSVSNPTAALLVDISFLLLLSLAVWREIISGRNWKNIPVGVLLALFAAANLMLHLGATRPDLRDFAIRLALGAAAVLIALIGGRLTPSFTRNWLVKRGVAKLPAPFGWLDGVVMSLAISGMAAWILAPGLVATGVLLLLGGAGLILRLARWRGYVTWREPIVAVLHVGYLWLAASFLLLGIAALRPDVVPESAALHALTAGAITTMTLAVMTRATRGHTGRAIEADAATVAIYVSAFIGALLRVGAPLVPGRYLEMVTAGGLIWSLAFALFAIRYGPMLITRRR